MLRLEHRLYLALERSSLSKRVYILLNSCFAIFFVPDPDGNKETKKKGLAGGVLAAAVVGFLIVFSVITLLLHLTVKKLKEHAKARRRGSAKQYVNDSNISSNGKAVTIGTRNKSFEDEITQSESALY